VYGFKPTFGTVAVAGMKPVAPSLDTVGWFSRSAGDLAGVLTVLTGRSAAAPLPRPPVAALVRTGQWDMADDDSRRAVLEAAGRIEAGGGRVVEMQLPPLFDDLSDRQPTLMAFEAARSLAWERRVHADLLSADLLDMLDRGWDVAVDEVDAITADAAAARS